ncbi:NXPE family member 3-like isoform X1 [Lytechinus pictus]|uniref:NXPE family member 3-like isoform X1 n=1 Tax=Lytechinus pictus TaxID=7653 RepID=UPI0030BA05BA
MLNEVMVRVRSHRIVAWAVGVVVVLVILMWSRGDNDTTKVFQPGKDKLDVVKGRHDVTKPSPLSLQNKEDFIRLMNTTMRFCRIEPTSEVKQRLPLIKPFDWTLESDITSRVNSTFEVIDKKKFYHVCDRIQVKITARNGRNEQKKYGGDYFRARIITNDHKGNTKSSMSDGEIDDHGDGTYTATFSLKWPGEMVIRIYLVHPSEAVSVLQKQSQSQRARYSYKGIFCSDKGVVQEERECNVFLSQATKHICKFTDRRTRLSWYCHHPTIEGLDCSHWCRYRSDSRSANVHMMTSFTEREKKVLQMYSANTLNQLHSVDYTIQVKPDRQHRRQFLPPCKPGVHGNSSAFSGYYAHDDWRSPYCHIMRFSSSRGATVECLREKTIFFMGDTTVKHLFNYFLDRLEGNFEIFNDRKLFFTGKNSPILAVDKKHQTNLIFRTHGYPIADDSIYDTQNIQYLANTIDDMQAGDDSAVIISMWRYFTPHNASFYEERIKTVVEAVKRLHERSPRTLVVFNSPNTGNMDTLESIVYSSDWYVRYLNEILRRVLSGYDRVGFLDSWDMTNAQLFPHRTHPVGMHSQNLADHLLSYICPSSK